MSILQCKFHSISFFILKTPSFHRNEQLFFYCIVGNTHEFHVFFSETLRIKFDTKKTNGHIKRETSRSSTSFLQAINHWECRFKKANQRKQYLQFLWPWSLSTTHRPTDRYLGRPVNTFSSFKEYCIVVFQFFLLYFDDVGCFCFCSFFFSMVVKWFSARHFGSSFVWVARQINHW